LSFALQDGQVSRSFNQATNSSRCARHPQFGQTTDGNSFPALLDILLSIRFMMSEILSDFWMVSIIFWFFPIDITNINDVLWAVSILRISMTSFGRLPQDAIRHHDPQGVAVSNNTETRGPIVGRPRYARRRERPEAADRLVHLHRAFRRW
jgi:hypothetical protein